MAGTGRKTWAADEILAAADLQNYIQDQVVFVYDSASTRASGILTPTEGMISYLKDTNALEMFDGSNWVNVLPNTGTAGTYTKVTTDVKGRVTAGTTLSAGDIPTIDVNSQTSGTLAAARVADLDASKVTTGAFNADRIPSLDTSKITTGNWDASRITSGTLDTARIPSLDANKITSGTLTRPVSTSGSGAFGSLNINGANAVIASDGAGYFNASLTNPYANSHPVSGQAIYMSSVGTFGVGASTERVKKNIVDASVDVDAVLQVRVRNFVYDSKFVESDGSVQIGVIAEELEALGLVEFVIYDEAGVVTGVHYDKLALALIPVVQLQQARLDDVVVRLNKLESK